jgi:hypothetical protein
MKRIALASLLLLAATTAAAQRRITSLTPNGAFDFAETTVVIRGVDLVPEPIVCNSECGGRPCPVIVMFGDVFAPVQHADNSQITVRVPAQDQGLVTVTVSVPSRPDLTFANFRFGEFVEHSELYTRYLVPLPTVDTRGGADTTWHTRLMLFNGSEHSVVPVMATPPRIDPPLINHVAPSETAEMALYPSDMNLGLFFFVPAPLADTTQMEMRTRIPADANQNYGVEVPVVPQSEFRSTVHLLGIPTDVRYRGTLRIYGDTNAPMKVRVRMIPEEGTEPVEERVIQMTGVVQIAGDPWPLNSAYAQLDPMTPVVRAAGGRVRIEVRTELDQKVWAMYSMTNNTTRQATLITPNR